MARHADQAPPVLFTVKEAAAYLSLSTGAMYELCRAKKIRHLRMGVDGGTIRISPNACDEYLQECEQEPQSAPALPEPQKRRAKMTGAQRAGLRFLDIPEKLRA